MPKPAYETPPKRLIWSTDRRRRKRTEVYRWDDGEVSIERSESGIGPRHVVDLIWLSSDEAAAIARAVLEVI